MNKLTLTLFLLTAIPPLPAQLLHFGVKGGIPLNEALEAGGTFKTVSKHWTLGPTLDIKLPAGFGLEADLLYRRVGYTDTALGKDSNAGQFNIPILLKYHFPGHGMARLYVEGGVAFRAITDVPYLAKGQTQGGVLGAGIRYDLKAVKITPELRFTRWADDMFSYKNTVSALSSRKTQAELLVGISF